MTTEKVRRKTLARLRALLLAMSLVLGGLTGVVVTAAPASATIGTDDYPSNLSSVPHDTAVDPWGFYNDECVSFVAWRLTNDDGMTSFSNNMSVNGVKGHYGYAYQWKDNAVMLYGASVYNGTPAPGSVAWWDANHGDALANGHVAYVDSVNADGSINIEEYNAWPNNYAYTSTTIKTSSSNWPSGFLHLKDLSGGGGGGSSLSNSSYIKASDTGNVYVMAGGSAMYVSSWASVGGAPSSFAGTYTQAQINAMPQYPADGTAIRNYSTGAIYVVAGGFPFAVSSLAHIPNTSWVNIDGNSLRFLRSQPADGTVIRDYVSGSVYVVSGGAAMAVTSMGNIPYTTYTNIDGWAITNQMRQYPTDGSTFVDYSTGTVYVVAGGAALGVTNFSHIPPVTSPLTYIDHWDLANQLRQYPADGTVIRDYVSGSIYVVSGGAAMAVTSLSNIPPTTWVNIDGWAVANQLRQYPTDGSTVIDYSTQTVYVIAGGSPMVVTNFNNIPPTTSVPYVDDWAIHNQLRQYPADGTVIRDYVSGGIYVVAGGSALAIASLNNVPYRTWVNVDGWGITHQLLSYPMDGTYVRDYTTGKVYSVQSGATNYQSSWGPSGPQPYTDVDPWSLVNQLHAVG